MSRVDDAFRELKGRGMKALIPYVTAGDPDLDYTERLVRTLAEAGADLIELGIPFSDPLADGPVIQRASARALANGVRVADILGAARRITERVSVPLLLMTYYNPVYHLGLGTFCGAAAHAGVAGLLVPDLPLEECEPLRIQCERHGLDLIQFLAPTSTPERIRRILAVSRGFAYCVSVTGVTGAQVCLADQAAALLRKIPPENPVPLALGFGIATAEQAREAARLADAVVVGSALVRRVEEAGAGREGLAPAAGLVRELATAVHASRAAFRRSSPWRTSPWSWGADRCWRRSACGFAAVSNGRFSEPTARGRPPFCGCSPATCGPRAAGCACWGRPSAWWTSGRCAGGWA